MTAPPQGAVLDADGWITHDGGPNPVPGKWCEVRFSDHEVLNSKSDNFQWAHKAELGWSNIIAYRLARPTPEGETTPSITAPMESEAAPDVSQRAKALSELAALDGEAMDLPAQPEPGGLGHTDLMISPEAIDEFLATADHPLITPEPGAGELEVVAWRVRTSCGLGGFLTDTHPDNHDQLVGNGYSVHPLTDHTQAQAKIARLEGEVAERDARVAFLESCFTAHRACIEARETWITDLEKRALSAEADAAKVREALVQEREENLWHAYHSGTVADGKWDHLCMSDGEWLARECGFDAAERVYSDDAIKSAIPGAARRALEALAAQTERRA